MNPQRLVLWLVALSAFAMAGFAVFTLHRDTDKVSLSKPAGLVEDIVKFHRIRAGYGILPPYTQEDPVTHKVTGLSVDFVNEIAAQIGVTVEWKRFHWATMKADMDSGDFDFVSEPVYESIDRGRDFTFTEPYAYFVLAVGIARPGETRFADLSKLDSPDVKIAIDESSRAVAVLKARTPTANVALVPSQKGSAEAMNMVLSGAADVAIVDLKQAQRFAGEHPNAVSILWESNPPAYVPAGFALRSGDHTGADFLNVAIDTLRSMGAVRTLAERYQLSAAFRGSPATQP